MKSLILMSIFTFSAYAFSCPTYNASYVCDYHNGPEAMSLTTRVENGIYIYKYNGMDLIADGITRFDPTFDADLTVACKEETLTFTMTKKNLEMPFCLSKKA